MMAMMMILHLKINGEYEKAHEYCVCLASLCYSINKPLGIIGASLWFYGVSKTDGFASFDVL